VVGFAVLAGLAVRSSTVIGRRSSGDIFYYTTQYNSKF
jgi:hypothetical protein